MLDKQTAGKYDEAWQKTVHTLSTDYAIAIMDKDSGYLRTEWVRGVSGGSYDSYRARISVRYPDVNKPYRLQYRTDAQWLEDPKHNQWGLAGTRLSTRGPATCSPADWVASGTSTRQACV